MEILIIITYLILTIVVGFIAKNKGRSSIGFVFLALLLSPLIVMFVLLIIGDSDDLKQQRLSEYEFNKKESNFSSSTNQSSSDKKYENLAKIGELVKNGLMTPDEFEIEKKKILSSQGNTSPESKTSNLKEYLEEKKKQSSLNDRFKK